MSSKLRILVDTNIVLDVLAKREPHYTTSAAVWTLVEQGEVEGRLAAHTVTTLYHLIAKHLGQPEATLNITKLIKVFDVATVDGDVINKALTLAWKDFEDAVQMAAAFQAQVNYLITRNPKDFKTELVRVLPPGSLLALLSETD